MAVSGSLTIVVPTHPLSAPSLTSPTDSISGVEPMHVFGDPFPNTRQATKIARETSY